jgi:aconitase A
MMAGCGKMILGSDSHTRYGALGTMSVGEGGPELVKQLLGKTYDVARPEVVLVWLENAPRPGVGPQDIAIALIGAVFKNGFVKNRVMEFAGPGVAGLSVEYRCGIDVMTTETTCLSSIWTTDDKVRDYLAMHGRADDYRAASRQARLLRPLHPRGPVRHRAHDGPALPSQQRLSRGRSGAPCRRAVRRRGRRGPQAVRQGR